MESHSSPRKIDLSSRDNFSEPHSEGMRRKQDLPKEKGSYTGIIVGAITTAVVGILVAIATYTVSNIVHNIENIERTIAKHHGPEWAKIDSVIEVGKIRTDFLSADNKLREVLTVKDQQLLAAIDERKLELEKSIADSNKQISELSRVAEEQKKLVESMQKEFEAKLEAFRMWIDQGDSILAKSQTREVIGNAQLNNTFSQEEYVGVINLAHDEAHRFAVGDQVTVKNETSGQEQTVSVRLESTFKESDRKEVLIQLSNRAAHAIGFSAKEGVIRVSVASQTKRFQTLKDFMVSASKSLAISPNHHGRGLAP